MEQKPGRERKGTLWLFILSLALLFAMQVAARDNGVVLHNPAVSDAQILRVAHAAPADASSPSEQAWGDFDAEQVQNHLRCHVSKSGAGLTTGFAVRPHNAANII